MKRQIHIHKRRIKWHLFNHTHFFYEYIFFSDNHVKNLSSLNAVLESLIHLASRWIHLVCLVLTVDPSDPLLSHYTLPFSHFKGDCVFKWWHTSVYYLHTCSLQHTCKPCPQALLWLVAVRGPVISSLVITELSSHENSLSESSHAVLLFIYFKGVNSKFFLSHSTAKTLFPSFSRMFSGSHRSPTATRSWGGCGRRWWPRSRWCGWRGCCPRRTSAWSRKQSISSPPDGQRA